MPFIEWLEPRISMSAVPLSPTRATVEMRDALIVPGQPRISFGSAGISGKIPPQPNPEPLIPGNLVYKDFAARPLFGPAGGPRATDIHQGAVGDCYFLATVAEIALKSPSVIEDAMTTLGGGVYDVHFQISMDAEKLDINEVVDSRLPVTRAGQLEYAKLGAGGCTWVGVLEKAYSYVRAINLGASSQASYEDLAEGSLNEVQSLFGVSANLTPITTAAALSAELKSELSVSGVGAEIGTSGTVRGLLAPAHAYSVIAVRESRTGTQVELRNPWGTAAVARGNLFWINVETAFPQIVGCAIDVTQPTVPTGPRIRFI